MLGTGDTDLGVHMTPAYPSSKNGKQEEDENVRSNGLHYPEPIPGIPDVRWEYTLDESSSQDTILILFLNWCSQSPEESYTDSRRME